jgi:hypothetical protein
MASYNCLAYGRPVTPARAKELIAEPGRWYPCEAATCAYELRLFAGSPKLGGPRSS